LEEGPRNDLLLNPARSRIQDHVCLQIENLGGRMSIVLFHKRERISHLLGFIKQQMNVVTFFIVGKASEVLDEGEQSFPLFNEIALADWIKVGRFTDWIKFTLADLSKFPEQIRILRDVPSVIRLRAIADNALGLNVLRPLF
jgi:hypothetical protein